MKHTKHGSMISEQKVKRAVERHMDAKQYMKIDSREKFETGMDLVFRLRRGGRYYYIEAKGETGAKSEMETKVIHGLGQLLKNYRHHANYYYGLAIPASWQRRALLKVSPDAMKALHLVLFLVDENNRVKEVRTHPAKNQFQNRTNRIIT